MPVVAKHVEARARRREQHRIALARRTLRRRDRLIHIARMLERDACLLQRVLDARRIAPDQNDGSRVPRNGGCERREVLSLSFPARDQDRGPADSRERRNGRAHVGALRIVVEHHPAQLRDALGAVRQPLEMAQRAGGRPRLSVFRSVAHIYVQVVDDLTGRTIASASSVEPGVKGTLDKQSRGGNVAGAKAIGKAIAERLIEKGVKRVVFDRNGFLYHGRVKAVADAAREAGLEF